MQLYAVTDKLILSEFYPLGSLENYIEKGGKPHPLNYATQLCQALSYLHDLGYSHGQVFPYNILVGFEGSRVLIADFGTLGPANKASFQSTEPQAPDLFNAFPNADGYKADIYSLGCIIWYMQHGGEPIPDNLVTETDSGGVCTITGLKSHLELVDLEKEEMELKEIVKLCWGEVSVRPNSREILSLLTQYIP